MSWRPEGWNRKKPRIGTRYNDVAKVTNLADSILARSAFEAGADTLLEAQMKEGRYFVKGSNLVSEGNPDVHFDFSQAGWLVFIREEETK